MRASLTPTLAIALLKAARQSGIQTAGLQRELATHQKTVEQLTGELTARDEAAVQQQATIAAQQEEISGLTEGRRKAAEEARALQDRPAGPHKTHKTLWVPAASSWRK